MIKSIPFTPIHIRMVDLNQGYDRSVLENYQNMAGFHVETIVKDVGSGKQFDVLAVFSGMVIMKGNLEVSALASEKAKKYPLGFIRHTRGCISKWERDLGVRRVQCVVRTGFPFLVKFIESLGFEREGYLRKFGPEGDDYFIYARVKA